MEWNFQYAGPAEEAEELLAPFNAIDAISEEIRDVSYPTASGVTNNYCVSAGYVISHVMTLEYNVTAQRALYDHFVAKVAEYPELGATAWLFHEGYATAGYQAIPSESTSYPHREENHLM